MKHPATSLLIFTLISIVSCDGGLGPVEPIDELPRALSVSEELLIDADNRFATKLFGAVVEQAAPASNVFISPLSIGMALGMTYNGAAGETQAAMQEALELQGLSIDDVNSAYRSLIDLLRNLDRTVAFNLANSIWYRAGASIVPEFLDVNQRYFDAEIQGLDFSSPGSANIINEWVELNTQGKIKKIVKDSIDDAAIMFLINAIYFKGTWTYQFDKGQTEDAAFHLENGEVKTVRMMAHKENAGIQYFRNDRLQAIDVPYGGRAFSMTILLPEHEETVDSIITNLTYDSWQEIIEGLHSRSIIVEMPKFRLEYELDLVDALSSLGMGIAFSPAANFTKLYAGSDQAYLSEVKHKTFVEVDEEGTEAAAVTSVGVVAVCACPPPRLRIDRPFVFVIRERFSNTTLFIGRMADPTKETSP